MRRPPTSISISEQQARRSPAYLSQANTDFASTPPRIIKNNQNVSVVLSLIEMESGSRVDIRPLWVDGPNAGAGDLAVKNQHLIRQLLTLRGLPTEGNVGILIPQLAGLEFDARLVLDPDGRTGRTYNALADIYADDGP